MGVFAAALANLGLLNILGTGRAGEVTMKSFSFFKALAIAAPLVLMAAPAAIAGPVVAGFDATQLPRNDDGSTGPVAITSTFGATGLNFFGTQYTSLYVNNNGNVTFGTSLGTYTPFGLTGNTGIPIIAAFFADVDTRGVASGITAYGTGTFAGRDTFGVTYPAVGYFGAHTDLLNTFQILLTDRSDITDGDFDIYFNYDQVQWNTGDASGGAGGFGGTPAAVGYSAGTSVAGTSYQLPGSFVDHALVDGGSSALISNSNIGVNGRYLFQVRNGGVTVPPITSGVPEPATWAMMILGFAGIGATLRRRRAATGGALA